MTAEDITAPEIETTLGGRAVAMRFDHRQMRESERYWQLTMRTRLGYLGILDQAANRTYCGLGALAYGAVASAALERSQTPPDWQQFDRETQLPDLVIAARDMTEAALRSLPGGAQGETAKNG